MMPTRDWCPEKPKTAPPARQPRQLRDSSCLPELLDRPAESSQPSPALLLRVRTSQRRAKPHRRISNADSFLPRGCIESREDTCCNHATDTTTYFYIAS